MDSRKTARALMVLTVLFVQACQGADTDPAANPADTLGRAQRDSIAASLPIPGARGIGAALQARDAANARAQAHDSAGR